MELCRLPKWPHEVLGLEITQEEARRLLATFQVGELRFLELQSIEARTGLGRDDG